jgi:hypothetical protein
MDQNKLQQNIGALVLQLWQMASQMEELKVKADAYDALQVKEKGDG